MVQILDREDDPDSRALHGKDALCTCMSMGAVSAHGWSKPSISIRSVLKKTASY